MFDTLVTIVGNALTTPEWRRIQSNQSLVANFKVAANSRRYDKASGRWVDGSSLRVRVSCWRRLAENVASSVLTGDPVIVTGRLYSRDWVTEDGQHRVSYELDAVAVGHDLARGRGKFTRHRATVSTSAVDDDAADERVGGEASAPVPQLNDRPRTEAYDEDLGGYVTAVEADAVVQMVQAAGLSADRVDTDPDTRGDGGDAVADDNEDSDGEPEYGEMTFGEPLYGAQQPFNTADGSASGVPSDGPETAAAVAAEAGRDDADTARRRRRGRVSVPA
ncbi:MAG TPA: single-stranded DNA-binding protein [Micromonosporaceae bacterium]|nr:single-stranded DNA-binding protein [Micromonosporaceae bacterium]